MQRPRLELPPLRYDGRSQMPPMPVAPLEDTTRAPRIVDKDALQHFTRMLERDVKVLQPARESFSSFWQLTKPDMNWNWFNALVAAELQQFYEDVFAGKQPRLMLFAPPRHGKSEGASRRFPAWVFGKRPTAHFISCSYGDTLAQRMNRDVQRIMDTDLYREVFPDTLLNTENVATLSGKPLRNASIFEIVNHLGSYRGAGVGGGIMGQGFNIGLIDDPVANAEEALSETKRESVWEWYLGTFYNRQQPLAGILLIMCMTGDTPVMLADGTEKPLRNIRPGDEVATYKKGKLTTARVANWTSSGRDAVFTIKTTSGKVVRANGRHPFLINDKGEAKWIRTKDLYPGQEMFLVNGESGKGKLARGKNAVSPLFVGGTAHPTTTRNGGQTELGRLVTTLHRVVHDVLNTTTELLYKTTKSFLPSRAESVLSANGPQGKTFAHIGAGNFASTTATKQERSVVFSATTAIWQLATQKLRTQPSPLPSISDFTLDAITDIAQSGVEEVFDVQIEETENFIANGLVSHNTRWHKDDLAGRLLKAQMEGGDKWRVVSFPAIAEQNEPHRKVGEALHPKLFSVPRLIGDDGKTGMRKAMGTYVWGCMYQQRPEPRGGQIFKRKDWKFWKVLPQMEEVVISVDCAFKDEEKNDYVAIQAWGRVGANKYLMRRQREHLGFTATITALRSFRALYPNAVALLVEDKANGSAVIDTLKDEIAGVLAIEPEGGKTARAYAIQPEQEAGNLFLPDPSVDPEIELYLHEAGSFPGAPHDDEVDCTTQAINWYRNRTGAFGMLEYMRREKEEMERKKQEALKGLNR